MGENSLRAGTDTCMAALSKAGDCRPLPAAGLLCLLVCRRASLPPAALHPPLHPAPPHPNPMRSDDMDMPAEEAAGDAAEASGVKTYTLEEVATHNTETDAWIAVEGKVYDVTEW